MSAAGPAKTKGKEAFHDEKNVYDGVYGNVPGFAFGSMRQGRRGR